MFSHLRSLSMRRELWCRMKPDLRSFQAKLSPQSYLLLDSLFNQLGSTACTHCLLLIQMHRWRLKILDSVLSRDDPRI